MSFPPQARREDIEGLRGAAVLAVVLFHAGIPGFSGGYVGVDIFFVISGFLIISRVRRDLAAGQFSLLDFYEGRARRILPALLVLLGSVLLAAPLLLAPWDIRNLGHSLLAALGGGANVYFRHVTGDYFGDDSSLMPLLHTWSLGVEEQFYLLVPVLFALSWRAGLRGWIPAFLTILIVGSLIAAEWMVTQDRVASFFLLPYRAWELALGGLLTGTRPASGPSAWDQGAGLTGLGLILLGVLGFNTSTPFPGVTALVPCMGAALVIYSGGLRAGWTARLLSFPPLVFIGALSYSWYLWHWPLLAFANYRRQFDPEMSRAWEPLLVITSFGLAWLSWKYVESPFRDRARFRRGQIFGGAAAGIFVLSLAALFLVQTNFLRRFIAPEARRLMEVRDEVPPTNTPRLIKGSRAESPVLFGNPASEPRLALWGDSHAEVLAAALHEEASRRGRSFRYYGRSGVAPLVGAQSGGSARGRDGAIYTERVLQHLIADQQIQTVVLAARWAAYTEGYTSAYGPAEVSQKAVDTLLTTPSRPAAGSSEIRLEFDRLLNGTVGRLRQAGKRVILVYPIPEIGRKVPQTLAAEVLYGRNPAELRLSAEKIFFERQREVLRTFDGLAADPMLIRVKPHELLIHDRNLRLMNGADVLYRDDDHLSLAGARLILPLFASIWDP